MPVLISSNSALYFLYSALEPSLLWIWCHLNIVNHIILIVTLFTRMSSKVTEKPFGMKEIVKGLKEGRVRFSFSVFKDDFSLSVHIVYKTRVANCPPP